MTTPDDPRALVEPLVGQRVKLTPTTGRTRTGTIVSTPDRYRWVRVRVERRRTWWDRLLHRSARWDDRGIYAVEPWPDVDACTCPDFDVSRYPGEGSTLKGLPDPDCPQHGRSS